MILFTAIIFSGLLAETIIAHPLDNNNECYPTAHTDLRNPLSGIFGGSLSMLLLLRVL